MDVGLARDERGVLASLVSYKRRLLLLIIGAFVIKSCCSFKT